MTPNPGYNAGIAKRKDKERLAWTLTGAPRRTKDLRLTPLEAVAEGRKLRNALSQKLENSNPPVDPGEGLVYLVSAKRDFSALDKKIIGITSERDLQIATTLSAVDALPIGFLVFVWDKKWEQAIIGNYRPLIVSDPRSLKLNEQALKSAEKDIRAKLIKDGVVHDNAK